MYEEPGPIQRRRPHLGPNPDWSRALYVDVPSHDFCPWLMMAEINRRFYNAPGPLKVRFMFQDGLLGKYDYGPWGILTCKAHAGLNDMAYSNQMVTHVLRPAIKMLGAVNEPDLHTPLPQEIVANYCEYDYHLWQLVDASRAGFEVPRWQVPQWAKDEVAEFLQGEFPVVITLREAETQQLRNSNVDAWIKSALEICKQFPVLFLRDTSMLNCPIGHGMRTWPRASSNAYVRAALYEAAFCNLFSAGGAASWAIYSKAPYLIFKLLVPQLPDWDHGQAKGWKEQSHIEVGEQLPWASANQRMTWRDDTFEEILSEFEAFTAQAIATAA